ncbi:MAG TPA: HPr(Ser) kinase/phosphatase [Xanthomonadales bacterium]|nr:HPr(Ser) kinase/phosphatase [Xanthomonadales bacterium]
MKNGPDPGDERRISARELFDQLQERFGLRRVAGQRGEERLLDPGDHLQRRPTLVGFLNIIYPNKIQLIGSEELRYLDGLDARARWDTIAKIIAYRPTALVLTRDQAVPGDLKQSCEESGTPLWVSPKRGHEILTYVQYHLARALAPRVTLHGTYLEVYSIGVLIAGDSGAGKSELALELISRGHRLIADDAPEFTLIAPDVLDGTCPEMLQDLLEVRGLGVLNVREMFGHTAVKRNKYLRLVVELRAIDQLDVNRGLDRLHGLTSTREVIDVAIPQITIPIAPGRNLAVLVEAAVRNHILRAKGIDPAQTFIDRQAHEMRRSKT